MGITETLKVLEELASSNLSLSQRVSDTVLFGHRAVERFGTPEAKEKYLKGILDGTIPNALCFCDPESGSDPMTTNVMLKATDSPDTFTLNGTKTWVSNATHAKVFTGRNRIDLRIIATKKISSYFSIFALSFCQANQIKFRG